MDFINRLKLRRFFHYRLLIIIFLIIHISLPLVDGQDNKPIEEYCNDSLIKSILIFRAGWELSPPVISLNSDEHLEFRFDDLDEEDENYSYSILNCRYNWQPNDISENFYLEGFNDIPIYNSQPSRNTTRYYSHLNTYIPGDDLQLIQSGNYVVRVYKSSEPDETVLLRKFAVLDEQVEISARVNKPNDEKQELMLTIDLKGMHCNNPVDEIKLVIIKNYDWNNRVSINSPAMLRENKLHLDMPYQIMHDGGNEFRWVDTKSTKFISERVEFIDYRPPAFHYYLKPDALRLYEPYFSSKDLNGRSFYEISNANDRHVEADYVHVHFTLESDQALGTDVYVYGELTDWKTSHDNYMVYNPEKRAYEKSLLVKQGMLNYAYATRDYNSEMVDFNITEGNHSETENDYLIFVYHRDPMGDFDKLVGFKIVNSVNTYN